MSAKDIIHIRAPEYDATTGLDNLISLAEMQTGNFGDEVLGTVTVNDTAVSITVRDMAIALRTLHTIVRQEIRVGIKHGGTLGNIGEGALNVALTFSDLDKKQFPDLCTTIWGVELIQLIRANFSGGVTRMFHAL
jgi:hypothetical protein